MQVQIVDAPKEFENILTLKRNHIFVIFYKYIETCACGECSFSIQADFGENDET
jgi:hypothetical protein